MANQVIFTTQVDETLEDQFEDFVNGYSQHGVTWENMGQGDSLTNSIYEVRVNEAGLIFTMGGKWSKHVLAQA